MFQQGVVYFQLSRTLDISHELELFSAINDVEPTAAPRVAQPRA